MSSVHGTAFRRTLPGELTDLVGQQVRRVVAAVRDPRARALRRRRRARRAAAVNTTAVAVAAMVTAVVGEVPGALELSEVAGGSVTALALIGAGTAGWRAVQLYRAPLPAPASPPLPSPASAARAPLVRLGAAESGLAELLALLTRPRHGVPLLPPDAVASIRDAATEAGAALRGTAESLQAVERAVASSPAAERAALTEAVHLLAAQLDEGVDEMSALVGAAGHAVAAGTAGAPPARLADATERLAGLAAGLRELADPR